MPADTTAFTRHRGPDRRSVFGPAIKTQLPLIGGFLLLIAVAAGSVWLIVSANRFNDSVAQTLQVSSTGYRLLAMVQDAETGERGFLLTGNADYLKPYLSGRVEAPQTLQELQNLVDASDVQHATVTRLRKAVQGKLDDLALTVGLGQAGRREEALKHVNLNIGNDLMQQVRVEVENVEAEEARRLSTQRDAAERTNKLLGLASLLGIAVVFGLAGYAINASNRSTRELRKARDGLRHTNENLEGLVAERVADLQAANEEIQRFAYIVSHDLRAPLVNVMGFTSELDAARKDISDFLNEVAARSPELVTADRRAAIETDLPEALGFIRSSTAKMDRLINAILKLSREGRRVLTPQKIDLVEVVRAQGQSLRQQLEASRAELVVQDDMPLITSDRLAIEQIFGNLIENAVKYLVPGRPGRISVTGKPQGAYLRCDVTDNGRGIEAKDFERVFELFRRSGEQNTQGEGIGLAYVRNLARRLGGNVTVVSEFGVGSTFTLTLPQEFKAKGKER